MDKASSEGLTMLERENLRKSMEKLKGGASGILFCVTQLKGIQKHNEMVEANIKSRSQELELKEEELQSLSSDLDKRVEIFEKEKSEAGNLKKLVEECAEELRLKRNELTAKLDTSTRIQREIESKKKQLGQHWAELRRRGSEAQDRMKEMEEEIDRKRQELLTILDKIKESGKQFVMVDEQLESQRRLIEIKSSELVSKEEELERVRESIKLSHSDLELKKKILQSLNSQITVCGQEIDSKSKESGELQKLIEQQTSELVVMQNQHDSIRLLIQERSQELVAKEKRHEEISETICRSSSEMEERVKEFKAAETEASDLNVRSERFRQEIEGKEKKLDLLKNQIESEDKRLVQLKRETEEATDSKEKVLALILSKIEESGQQLAAVDEQLESQRRQLEMQSVELVSKEKELEILGESSKRFICDLEVKEKRFQALNNLIKISGEQLDLKSKELGEIERELKFKKQLRQMSTVLVKREKQPAATPISDSRQQNAAETEPIDGDALMFHGISASLTRHEVSSVLRASPNPAELVLELVQEEIREGSTLQDMFLDILVLLFEELAKIQQSDELAKIQLPDKSQLQLKATEVATLWKEKITIEAPRSSLEALAFLLFIMAYGLKTLINEEETALLASSIAQYEQAPRLFNYLSLNPMIREFVEELIKKSQYIPAVRLICLFKLHKEVSFSPSELLKKEIINFRRSALENRSAESSQAKEKDGGRLRAILELVADYKLEIDLPGDLIAKLMVQRERSAPLIRCSVEHVTSSSNPQAELKKKQLEQAKTVLVKHNGVEEEDLGITLPVLSSDVNSVNETFTSKHLPVIYTYQRKGN